MTETTRNPRVAMLVSLLAPGAGHVYAGRRAEGLTWSGGTVAVGMLGTACILASPGWARVTVVGAAACWATLWVTAAIAALRAARAAPPAGRDGSQRVVCFVIALLTFSSIAMWTLAVRDKVVQVFRIPSASMEPTVFPGAHVWVSKTAYATGPVRRGDIVVFANPNERYQRFIKRVIALPGDSVELRDDRVVVNREVLPRSESGEGTGVQETNGGATYRIRLDGPEDPKSPSTFAESKVPNGHCFLLGDNRHHSIDSRQIGPVPLTDIVGPVQWVTP